MRKLIVTTVFLILAGCIHLPAEVAAVVQESDPPGRNHFRPDIAPAQSATNAQIPPP